MKNEDGMKPRDEVAVSIRDMVFVACGTVLIITGHLYFAIAAFVCAAFRFEFANYIVFAKKLREYSDKLKSVRSATDQLMIAAQEKKIMPDEFFQRYWESVK